MLTCALVGMLGASATMAGPAAASAGLLEHDAHILAIDSRADAAEHGTADYSRPADGLADLAGDFRRTIADREADRRDVTAALDRLSHGYDELRNAVDRSGGADAVMDFRHVTHDYLGIERQAGSHRCFD